MTAFNFRGNTNASVAPRMPVNKYKTFAIRSPIETHFKKVMCSDPQADCQAYREGFQIWVDDPRITPALLHSIKTSGKRYREAHFGPGQNYLLFEAGQICFQAPHTISLQRPEFFYVGRGHWTVFNPRKARQHTRPEYWVEDFAHQLDHLRTAIERG